MALSGSQFVISAGSHQATVAEVGAGLRGYTVDGVDVTVPYGEDVIAPRGCGAVLVPWPNRLRGGRYTFEGHEQQVALTEPAKGNANHGLGRWARWTAVTHKPSTVTMTCDIVPQTGWPFEVRVEVTYALDAATGLAVTMTARNHGAGRAPFGAGCHPYLALRGHRIDDVTLRLPARQRLVLDDAQLPIGTQQVAGTAYDFHCGQQLKTLRLDDGFTDLAYVDGRGSVEVSTTSFGTQVWFDETFGFVQVYTHEDVVDGTPGVAVEPMTCAADAFNSGAGLIVIDPGGVWSGTWGIRPL